MATVPPAALMGGLIGAQAAVPAKGAVLSAPYLKRANPLQLQGVELPGPVTETQQETVEASYYGAGFAGRPTASGETFNPERLTAAHRTLPFGSIVKVTNARTGKSVDVKINDRGPFHGNRAIDLSTAAARKIGMLDAGTAKVMLEVVKRG